VLIVKRNYSFPSFNSQPNRVVFLKKTGLLGKYFTSLIYSVIIYSSIINMSFAAKAIPIQIGEWYLEPTIDITFGRSDSEFGDSNTSIGRERSKDSYLQIEPKFNLYNKNKDREISLSYEASNVDYKDNPQSDSVSSYLRGEYKKSISNKSDISLQLAYEDGNQTQGVRADIQSVNPLLEGRSTEFVEKQAVLKYEFYGEQNAGHNFALSLERTERTFQSPEIINQGRDIETNAIDARWRYLWSQGTGVFVNAKINENNYLRENESFGQELDNDQTQLMFGFEWRARENISGEFSAGIVKKSFDQIDLEVEVPAFYGKVEILPTRLDTFRLEGQRNPIEQAGVGAFQEYQEIELSWLRRMSPRWSMEASVATGRVDYRNNPREDRFYDYGLLFEYRVNRVADLIFGFKYYNDDSNQNEFDYNGSNFFITYSTGL
jgi:hypothetical protein